MKAVVSHNHQSRIQEVPKPVLQKGDLLLQIKACGVCFSDVHKLRFQKLDKPVILGHEVAGEVVEVGSEVSKFKVGDRVVAAHHVPCLRCHYCRHGNISMCSQFKKTNLDPGGFAEFVRVPATHVESVAFLIPAGLTENEASFMEPLGCSVRAIKRAGIQRSDVVVLVGLGSIGLLLLQLIRHAGAECIGVDLDQQRREFAKRFGLAAAFAGSEPGFQEYLAKVTEGRGADGVLLTAGNPALVSAALTWLREGGTCTIFASLHPESDVQLDWNQLYYRELNIVSSYSASPADLSEALELLGTGVVCVADLTRNTFSLEQFSDAVAGIENRTILKAIMTPNG
jgi:L-iditol 2-dehydrogenase